MVKTYNHEEKNVSDLIAYVNNSRTHSDEQILQIASSIKEFGFTNPVLIDNENGVIAGHGRLLAAKKLGIEKVPCIILDGLSTAQKKAYIIADNQIALNSGWNEELLKVEIEELNDLDFDIDLLGLDDEFLEELQLEVTDYSDKNKELDLDDFDDSMQMKFDLSKEQFEFIRDSLLNINESKEIALLQVLNYE